MWTDIWTLQVPLLEKVLRPVLVYLFLVVALRLAGRRELAQLTTMDFIVLLAVANAVQNGIIGNDNSVTGAFVGAAVLFVLNGALAAVFYRFPRIRRVVAGRATMLIEDGKLDEKSLRRERLSKDDLLSAVQENGADSFDQVSRACLEPNGKLVVEVRPQVQDDKKQAALESEVAAMREQLAELTELVRRSVR